MIKIIILLLVINISITFSKEGKKLKAFGLEETMKFENFTYKMISDNGDWLVYGIKPDRGDGKTVVLSTRNDKKYEIVRAENAKMSESANYIALTVTPDVIQTENLKKNQQFDTLYILNTGNGDISKVDEVERYDISNDGKWLYYSKKIEKENKKNGRDYFLRHLESNSDIALNNINNIEFDSTSSFLLYSKISEDNRANGIYYRDLAKAFAPELIIQKDTNYVFDSFSHNLDFGHLVFKLAKIDSNKVADKFELSLYNFQEKSLKNITKADEFKGWYIPKFSALRWTDNGERLFYGVKPNSEYINEDDKDKDKKIKLEDYYDYNKILEEADLYLWHQDDDRIMTHKRTQWSRDKNKTYDAIFHLKGNLNVRLGDTNLPDVSYTENKIYTIAYDQTPYERRITYDGWYFDLYVVDLYSGERVLIEKELYSRAYISDFNPHVVYYKDKHWHFYDVIQRLTTNITDKLKQTKFYDELHDTPNKAESYGVAGWGEECKSILLYDRYDIWEVMLPNCSLINLNQGAGRMSNKTYRIVNLDPRQKYVDHTKSVYLKITNNEDKSCELLHLRDRMDFHVLKDSIYWAYELKAKYSNDIVVSRRSYDVFPDLYLTNDKFENPKKMTNIHPEIPEYNWGYTEMVKYTNAEGDTLQGYVIKPNNFDPNKKYPLLIYFYERFSDRRHQFTSPRILHRPIYPWYISEGYCMFFPDIKFYEGKPGDSGMDAVIAGCDKLISEGYIDKSKIALHGHSWSGYQSAYFVTQTDYFAACVSGAPVSNMTSAYSGIRLGSGLARQFQYEKQQSRIGGNLIDSLDAYIKNSPVFFADKMNTPTLVMFGDKDDAVPWEQGIEFYLACRRFDKPCFMLQYENEPHHLKKYPNKLDYTIKMKQFFDHYVLGKEPADWIIKSPSFKGKHQTMKYKE